ncbi:enolase C-terminal domain-like protein [Streptomyces sp. NPDC047043]|uniref:enolase C-terminal domain-like protein n=1 Tax=Streptomyces sp. NPDC047043 TaxID=3154497 RepID=UPI0033FBF4E8
MVEWSTSVSTRGDRDGSGATAAGDVVAVPVVECELRGIAIPNVRPVHWEGGIEAQARFMVLTLWDADGRRGIAECTVKPTWNGFDADGFAVAFERLVLPVLWSARTDMTALPERLGRLVENSAPKALLESALWDLSAGASATAADVPARPVPVSATITRGVPADMAAEAAGLVQRYGFGTLKVKGGQDVSSDLDVVRRVRAAVGADVALYVDANGAVPAAEAEDYVARLADLGVVAVEDPYNLALDRRLERVQAASRVPVIADFVLDGVSAARAALDLGCGGISLKPSRFGMRKVLAMGEAVAAADALGVIGLFGESHAGAVHLLAAHRALAARVRMLPAEAAAPLLLTDHYLHEPLEVTGGTITPPAAANLAALVDPVRLERLTTLPRKRWRREL